MEAKPLETPNTTTVTHATDDNSDSTSTATTAPEHFSAKEAINGMKSSLDVFDEMLNTLHAQTVQGAIFGEYGGAQEIKSIRSQIKEQDRKHKHGLEEIELILKDLLANKVVEQLKRQVEEEVASQIDQLVEEQVALCLKTHIPQELQDELAEQKRELKEVRRQLHNSESRRSNATLRLNSPNDHLQTILMSNGEISTHFPDTLKGLFKLDAKTSKALMLDYEIPDASDSRERNLNRIMQFFGVSYQVVRSGAETRPVGMQGGMQ